MPLNANQPVRILLADDEPVILQAVSLVLRQSPGIEVIATTLSTDEAFTAVQSVEPDVLIHELSFVHRSGIELVRDMVAAGLATACIAFTRLPAATYAEHYLRAGGRGFVPKSEPVESLIRAIRVVVGGGLFMSEAATGGLLSQLANPSDSPAQPSLKRLTTSEFQVLQLISQGMANRAIAETLHRSIKTVETYRSRMKKKLGLTNGVELAQFAALHFREQRSLPSSATSSPSRHAVS